MARRIGSVIGAIELAIGAITLLIIFIVVLLQAVQRYLPIEQFAWTGEIAKFSMIWLTFAVLGLLVTKRGHIALEIADALPPVWARIVQVFALVVVAATGVGLTLEAFSLVATQGMIKSPVLRLPMSWVYIPLLIGAASTAIRAAIAALDVAINGPVFPVADADETEVPAS